MVHFAFFTFNFSLLTCFINWNVNPEIFRLGTIAVRWYGLLFAFAFLCGYFILTGFLIKEKVSLQIRDSLLTYMFLGTVIGARLGHCLFYEPGYYLHHPWDILKIWEGGLSSHGAAIGILTALYIYSRQYKTSHFWILDRMVILITLGGAFIRTGNLMNSEIVGKASNAPWAFVFTRLGDGIPRHPTQIYEALFCLLIFTGLISYYYYKNGKPNEGVIFSVFLIALFTVRFFIEFFKEVQVDFENSLALNLGQLLSLPFIFTGIILLIFISKRSKS